MKYLLSGGDGGAYGPVFGPTAAEEMGEIAFLPDGRYLLLKVLDPLTIKKDRVEYLLISPRHQGNTIESLRTEECAVGIGRVLPGKLVNKAKGLGKDDVEYFAVGQSKPIAA